MMIVIEGGDACGKATQSRMLFDAIEHRKRLVSFPRYETEIGQLVLQKLKEGPEEPDKNFSVYSHNLLLQIAMTADRLIFQSGLSAYAYQHLGESHEHMLICDRWWQSGFVYGSAAGLSSEHLHTWPSMHRQADLNILIDVPADVAMSRRPPRDKFEEKLSFRQKVRETYLKLWEERRSSPGSWLVIDGTMTPDHVHSAIVSLYNKLFRSKLCKGD